MSSIDDSLSENSSAGCQILEKYNQIMASADPRVRHLPLTSSPFPHLGLLFLYLLFVWRGPHLMKDRPPFRLRGILLVYNFFLVALSVYMCYEFLMAGWLYRFSLGCEPIDFRPTEENFRMIHVGYLFWISKLIELLDTVFFILRKKNNQVSFLHVIHHTAMPFAWWCGLNWAAGGMGTFHGMINSFVHVMMYSYYGLSAIGPQMQKYLGWKKYLTKMQLIQFVIVLIHTGQLFFIECDYPRVFLWMISSYAFVFFVLFSNFYIQTYLKSRRGAAALKETASPKMKNGVHLANGYTKHSLNGYHNYEHMNGSLEVEKKVL